jgi:hypothetical protein
MGIAAIVGTASSSPLNRKRENRFVDLLMLRSGMKSTAPQDTI